MDFNSLYKFQFVHFNNNIYKSGLFLIENFSVYNIIFVLKSCNDYYFLCELFETKKFEVSLNSIEVQPYCLDKQLVLVKHSDSSNF